MATCQGYADVTICEFYSIDSEVSTRKVVLYLFQRCKDNVATVSGGNIKFIAEEVPNCNIMTISVSRLFNFRQFQITLRNTLH